MSQLHELLAVEGDLEGAYKKILEETKVQFEKHPERYFGQVVRVESFDENAPAEAPVQKELDDTVPAKLEYTKQHIIRYLDAVLQKEATNQTATASLMVDGKNIAADLPVTFLLGLENKLKAIRTNIYETIPTLQPGVRWELDETIGKDVYRRVNPEEKFRTKKIMKNHVVAEATPQHPAQVQVYTEDEKVARVITNTWCGMISPADKSAILGRVDKLIRAVKKARQQANTQEVLHMEVGKAIFDYIHAV